MSKCLKARRASLSNKRRRLSLGGRTSPQPNTAACIPVVEEESLPLALRGIPSLFCAECSSEDEDGADDICTGTQEQEEKEVDDFEQRKVAAVSRECTMDNAKDGTIQHVTEQFSEENTCERMSEQVRTTSVAAGVAMEASVSADAKLEREVTRLMLELEDRNREKKQMKARLDRASEIITDLIKLVQQKDDNIKGLQQANESLQLQDDELKKRIGELFSQLNSAMLDFQTDSEKLSLKEKQIHNKNQQVMYHRKRCDELKDEFKNARFHLPESAQTRIDALAIVSTIREIIQHSIRNMQTNSESSRYLFELLTKLLLDETIPGGQMLSCSYETFQKYVRRNIFAVHKVLRHMDLTGGVLNFEGIEVLREIESRGQPYAVTLLPSTAKLQKVAFIVECYGKNVCPFKMIKCGKNKAEGFAFRVADVLLCSIIAGGAAEEAKLRPIEVSRSMDSALFTKHLGHTLGGIKFNNRLNPFKQSRNLVFPVVCICARETSGLVRGPFARMFLELEEAAKTVLPNKFGFQPITVTTNCDMSCDWKLSGRGGGSGQRNFPCAKRAQQKGTLHLPTQMLDDCRWCLSDLCRPGAERCFHTPMCTPEHIEQMQERIDQLKNDMPNIIDNLEHIRQSSNLHMDEDPQEPTSLCTRNLKSIHFDLSKATRDKRAQYGRFLTGDMRKRRMDVSGTLEERQERLLIQLILEYNLLALW
ncbi:hypothetical protein ACA910_013084 [Epithemia clementina (nom. ined.)]